MFTINKLFSSFRHKIKIAGYNNSKRAKTCYKKISSKKKMMSSSATVNLLDQNGVFNNNTNAMNINPATNIIRNTVVDFSVGSMPANYGYDESFSKEEEEDDTSEESSLSKPRILIMGLRK